MMTAEFLQAAVAAVAQAPLPDKAGLVCVIFFSSPRCWSRFTALISAVVAQSTLFLAGRHKKVPNKNLGKKSTKMIQMYCCDMISVKYFPIVF